MPRVCNVREYHNNHGIGRIYPKDRKKREETPPKDRKNDQKPEKGHFMQDRRFRGLRVPL